MYFQTELQFEVRRIYLQIKYLYISYFVKFNRDCSVRIIGWIIQIPSLHLPAQTQQ